LPAEQANSYPNPHDGGLSVGKILIGVIIGIILVIWLLASCMGAIF
jgi:hypothetical protein